MHPVLYRLVKTVTDPSLYSDGLQSIIQSAQKNQISPTLQEEYMHKCASILLVWVVISCLMYCRMLNKIPTLPTLSAPGTEGPASKDQAHENAKFISVLGTHQEAMRAWTKLVRRNIFYNIAILGLFSLYHRIELAVCSWTKFYFWMDSLWTGTIFTHLVFGVKNYGSLPQEALAFALFFGLVMMIHSWVRVVLLFMYKLEYARVESIAWYLLGFVYLVAAVYFYKDVLVVAVDWMSTWWNVALMFYSEIAQGNNIFATTLFDWWEMAKNYDQQQT